jgi:hypothetical protein
MRPTSFLIALFLSCTIALAQNNIFLNLQPKFGTQNLQLLQTYVGNDGVAVEIEHFNYYLSDVKLFHDNGQITELLSDIWLITPQNFSPYLGYLDVNHIDSISFTIGVPKRYNTQAGALAQDISLYPETHPLSFQFPSMYWGWSAGYMHMIVGGKADSNNDNVPNNYFEMHNLGNNNQQMVSLPVVQTTLSNQIELHLNCHLDRWLNNMPLITVGVLHDETGLNATIMQNVLSQNVFSLDANANTHSEILNPFRIIHNNATIRIEGMDPNQNTLIEITDAQGKILWTKTIQQSQLEMSSALFPHGIYLLRITHSKGNFTQRLYF